jgi:hypothetical protein
MRDPELSRLLEAAAALLLRPPDAVILEALTETSGFYIDADRARQDFYDVLCMPQSGRYIPPYAHVLARGTVRDGEFWHFPQPRFHGGDTLAAWYAAVGFDPTRLNSDPMVRGPHRPLDHVGFILACLAVLSSDSVKDACESDNKSASVGAFLAQNVGVWFDRLCNLLDKSPSVYLKAVSGAVGEALCAARQRYPDVVSKADPSEPSRAAL